ncbi:MAG: hypothetical protein H7330_14625 [Hymenobacteraceae bacterium]|nr:hypothetical protein [Hymenobacteraceae bacterium]
MHSLGLFSLVFGASWLLPLLGYLAVREPGRSAYHHRARQLSFLFPVALGAALGAMLLLAPAYP